MVHSYLSIWGMRRIDAIVEHRANWKDELPVEKLALPTILVSNDCESVDQRLVVVLLVHH